MLKKKNIKHLKDVFSNMEKVSFQTTWTEAQEFLLDCKEFTDDMELQNMDKEDALIVFEEHIRQLEMEHYDDMEKYNRNCKRVERKNREAFLILLDDLHEQGALHSMSLWIDLYQKIASDDRFETMLGQSGSTPLDLFKFYVEDLKARFYDEKKIVKEILRDNRFIIDINTSFEKFAEVVSGDKRAACLDAGNIKLTFTGLMDKAEVREKERLKEEAKKKRKYEAAYRKSLSHSNIHIDSKWQDVRDTIKFEYDDFDEDSRKRLFYEHIVALEESKYAKRKAEQKKNINKCRSYSASSSHSVESALETNSNTDVRKHKRKIKHKELSAGEIDVDQNDSDNDKKRKRKKKKKNKKKRTSSASAYTSSEDELARKQRKKQKKTKTK
ncbi:hypothetical protein GJ496_004711 [Pomphorhynchus laevis]|nr:hypothetical protein GJ496_004711 [Pomphorhynchus laevis]